MLMMYELSPGYHLFPVYSCPCNSQLLALNIWSELSEVAPNVVPGQDAVLEQLAIFLWHVSELSVSDSCSIFTKEQTQVQFKVSSA